MADEPAVERVVTGARLWTAFYVVGVLAALHNVVVGDLPSWAYWFNVVVLATFAIIGAWRTERPDDR
jgi:hypothetical protein